MFLDSNRVSIPNLDELIRENLIDYEFGIEEYTFTTHKQHIKDLTALIDQKNEDQKKIIKNKRKSQ